MRFIFTSHISPKKNSAIINSRGGSRPRFITNPNARRSEAAIKYEAWHQARKNSYKPFDCPVKVKAIMKKTRADCIGVLETLLDALQDVAYINDKQVVSFEASWDLEGVLTAEQTCIITVDEFEVLDI